jgi:hypothetical protein
MADGIGSGAASSRKALPLGRRSVHLSTARFSLRFLNEYDHLPSGLTSEYDKNFGVALAAVEVFVRGSQQVGRTVHGPAAGSELFGRHHRAN